MCSHLFFPICVDYETFFVILLDSVNVNSQKRIWAMETCLLFCLRIQLVYTSGTGDVYEPLTSQSILCLYPKVISDRIEIASVCYMQWLVLIELQVEELMYLCFHIIIFFLK